MPHPLDTMSRQKKFLDIYKQTKDPVAASGEAWPELPPRRRAQMAKRTLTQPDVTRYLDRYNMSLPKIIKTHANLMQNADDSVKMRAVEVGYKMHGLNKLVEEVAPQQVQITIDPGRLAEVAARLEAINKKMLPSQQPSIDAEIL